MFFLISLSYARLPGCTHFQVFGGAFDMSDLAGYRPMHLSLLPVIDQPQQGKLNQPGWAVMAAVGDIMRRAPNTHLLSPQRCWTHRGALAALWQRIGDGVRAVAPHDRSMEDLQLVTSILLARTIFAQPELEQARLAVRCTVPTCDLQQCNMKLLFENKHVVQLAMANRYCKVSRCASRRARTWKNFAVTD